MIWEVNVMAPMRLGPRTVAMGGQLSLASQAGCG